MEGLFYITLLNTSMMIVEINKDIWIKINSDIELYVKLIDAKIKPILMQKYKIIFHDL